MKVVTLVAERIALDARARGRVADRRDRHLGICLGDWDSRAGLSFPRSPVDVLSTWDGTHYSTIARNGYLTEGAEVRRFEFFPLLPAISRLLGGAEHAALAGIVLNQLCLLVNILLIGRLVRDGGPPSSPVSQGSGYW